MIINSTDNSEYDLLCPECGTEATAVVSEISRGQELVHDESVTIHREDRDIEILYYIHA